MKCLQEKMGDLVSNPLQVIGPQFKFDDVEVHLQIEQGQCIIRLQVCDSRCAFLDLPFNNDSKIREVVIDV